MYVSVFGCICFVPFAVLPRQHAMRFVQGFVILSFAVRKGPRMVCHMQT